MALKVVVWGTGNVGRPAIRAVLSHQERLAIISHFAFTGR